MKCSEQGIKLGLYYKRYYNGDNITEYIYVFCIDAFEKTVGVHIWDTDERKQKIQTWNDDVVRWSEYQEISESEYRKAISDN
jgi:hypothetical protein